jgi:hypothetical protein
LIRALSRREQDQGAAEHIEDGANGNIRSIAVTVRRRHRRAQLA